MTELRASVVSIYREHLNPRAMRRSRRVLRQSAYLRALGAIIHSRRSQLHLTIVEIAHRAGTAPAALARLERGERDLTLLQLEAVAGALEMPLAQLLRAAEQRAAHGQRE